MTAGIDGFGESIFRRLPNGEQPRTHSFLLGHRVTIHIGFGNLFYCLTSRSMEVNSFGHASPSPRIFKRLLPNIWVT